MLRIRILPLKKGRILIVPKNTDPNSRSLIFNIKKIVLNHLFIQDLESVHNIREKKFKLLYFCRICISFPGWKGQTNDTDPDPQRWCLILGD